MICLIHPFVWLAGVSYQMEKKPLNQDEHEIIIIEIIIEIPW